MNLSPADLEDAMTLLGILPMDILNIKEASSEEEAQTMFIHLKKTARENFRHLSKFLHPDKNNNDEEKTDLFKKLAFVLDRLNHTQVGRTSAQYEFTIRVDPYTQRKTVEFVEL